MMKLSNFKIGSTDELINLILKHFGKYYTEQKEKWTYTHSHGLADFLDENR